MTEAEQLEQTIAALEAQRGVLGDVVVDSALGPLREKLAMLHAHAAPAEQKRKQVTVLFADVSGFTALSETLDAEEVTEFMNALWARLDAEIATQGGQIDKHIGDAVMAIWGSEAAREDDPERAIRAALAMQANLAGFREENAIPLAMRIGVNTGPVVLGQVGSTREMTAMGDAVNVASRLEHAAPVGGILISHDTYRHVRGVFDVQAQAPLAVKGKAEPVQTYVVLRARPRAFRMTTRGVEGIETRMVGRDAEAVALQETYGDALCCEARLALVVGDAGVGKSRLLSEFENWIDMQPESACLFRGRSAPATERVPYALLRDLFADRFDILETDSPSAALEKFRSGMRGFLPPERADLVGRLVGFDFSASPAVKNLAGSSDFGQLAQAYLIQYFRAQAERQPVIIFLDELHWADDASLDLVEQLLASLPAARMLIVALTRPVLFERRRHWLEGQRAVARLDLKPLSRRASRELVDEILQKMDAVPESLRTLIVEGAEGNPFYLEELIRMLIDDRVIVRGRSGDEAWSVDVERLKAARVPPTLTGVLQARLDGLPREEREVVQRAAVVGRLFWDAAVAELTEMERAELNVLLEAVRGRDLVYRHERSAFGGTGEFVFKHALLRDAAYETVLLKLRKDYHARVARWLVANAGERLVEYSGLIGEHLALAGQSEEAARYLHQSAERALDAGGYREALQIAERALGLLAQESRARTGLQILLGQALYFTGELSAAREQLEAALAAAEASSEQPACITALNFLGMIATDQGEYDRARGHLDRSLVLAQRVGDRPGLAFALLRSGTVDRRQARYGEAERKATESLAIYEALGDRFGMARAIILQAVVAIAGLGDHRRALGLQQDALALIQEIGARGMEAIVLNDMGVVAYQAGDYAQAQRYYRDAGALSVELGDRAGELYAAINLADAAVRLGDEGEARARYLEALRLARGLQALPLLLESLAGLAGILARAGQVEQSLELLGLVVGHPALHDDARATIDRAMALARSSCTEEQIEAGLARGKVKPLDEAVAALLR